QIDFDPDDVMEVASKVKEIFETEPVLIEDIPAGITVVTDLHGQLSDLDRVFQADSENGKPGYECTKYLFLGDYVDRGDMSLEVVMALFLLKILYPDRIHLLRGNHEFMHTNRTNGFLEEMYERYEGNEAELLFAGINHCFTYLSIAGIVGDKIFCVHGGISACAFTRNNMRKLQKPYVRSTEVQLIHDMVWADPAVGLRGIAFNSARHTSIYFGEDKFIHALDNIDCIAMIRGHQKLNTGFKILWNRLFCVFTATA
ncbi:hypothetical protein PFISCL1PPCAC_7418, partial [Pristionchus fissidentatus]